MLKAKYEEERTLVHWWECNSLHSAVTMENGVEVPQKTKNKPPHNQAIPLLGIYSRRKH